MILNDQQQAAIIAMLAFNKDENEKFISLIGAAGTGKTTTIQYLLEQVTDNTKVCFTAISGVVNGVSTTFYHLSNLRMKYPQKLQP